MILLEWDEVMNLMWFRGDLRLHDNPALFHAIKNGPTIAVYFVTKDQWQKHNIAPIKKDFILRQLLALSNGLAELNVPLIVLDAKDFSGVIPLLKNMCENHNIKQIFFNEEYEWNEQQLSEQVYANLTTLGRLVYRYHDQCLIAPGEIRNKQGGFYKVFTAFKKAYLQALPESGRPLYPKPNKQDTKNIQAIKENRDQYLLDKLGSDESLKTKEEWKDSWPAGEDHALKRLSEFANGYMEDYQENRDYPSIQGTSKLSAYMAIGAVSVRQCYQEANNLKGLESTGVDTWINELIWRDFYRHLMAAYPEICRYKPFKPHTDQLPWNQANSLFEAWCKGKTGYPLVDAAMRQLLETGWMHNRLRMVTAMFLTKHLFVDWRLGEQFFMQHLIDGDMASNNGGWQWSASTGVDAVPYFRIFNPTRQSQRFDANGDFIRKYVPELKSLDNKSIHQPSKQQIMQCGYVAPIVDHKLAVAQTKQHFKQLSELQTHFEPAEYGLS